MDYQACWGNLRAELLELEMKLVRSIDPEIVLAFMRYIEEREENRQVLLKSGNEKPGAGE